MESEELKLLSLAEVIDCYLRFAFIRSCKFTNNRLLIEKIVFTVFLDMFYMAQRLKGDGDLPVAIDIMIDAVGTDLTRREDCKQNGGLFIKEELHLHIVEAVNKLDSPERLVLVLFHIDKINIEKLAVIFAEPVGQMKVLIGGAQRGFIENLSDFMPKNTSLFAEDIDKWLGLLGDYFNQADMDRMQKSILARLSGEGRLDN